MKIVRFLGGLGNQMFQYAFYKSLEKEFKKTKADLHAFKGYTLHNGYELERIFGINLSKVPAFLVNIYDPEHQKWHHRRLRKILKLRKAYYYENPIFSYDETIYHDTSNKLYWGYWQNPSYFSNFREELLMDFTFKQQLNQINQKTLFQISESNSVAVHIRRGDYLYNDLLGNICDLNYFKQAIELIENSVVKPSFFVFSDDIPWCKEKLSINNGTYIDWNGNADSYIDMQLMSNCKHNIISNSSFSWWGAWLNTNINKIVVAPKKWVNDKTLDTSGVIPNEWIKL